MLLLLFDVVVVVCRCCIPAARRSDEVEHVESLEAAALGVNLRDKEWAAAWPLVERSVAVRIDRSAVVPLPGTAWAERN